MKKQTKTTNHKTEQKTVKKSGKPTKSKVKEIISPNNEMTPRYEMSQKGATEFLINRKQFRGFLTCYQFQIQPNLPIQVVKLDCDCIDDEEFNYPCFVSDGKDMEVGNSKIILTTSKFQKEITVMIDPFGFHSENDDILVDLESMVDLITGGRVDSDLLYSEWHRDALHCNRKVSPMYLYTLSLTHFANNLEKVQDPVNANHDHFITDCKTLDSMLNLPNGTYQEIYRLLVLAENTIRKVVQGGRNTLMVDNKPAVAAHFIPAKFPLIHYQGFANHGRRLNHGEFTCVHISDLAVYLETSAEELKNELVSWNALNEPWIDLKKHPEIRDSFYNYFLYRVLVPVGTWDGFFSGVSVSPPDCDWLVHTRAIPDLALKFGYKMEKSEYLNEVHKLKSQTLLMYLTEETQSTSHEQQPTQGENS